MNLKRVSLPLLLSFLLGTGAVLADDKIDDQGPTDEQLPNEESQPIDVDQPKEGPAAPSEIAGTDMLQLRQEAVQQLSTYPDSPQTASTLYLLGETYRRNNDFANALLWYNKALAILHVDPDNPQSYNLGPTNIDYRLLNQPNFGMPNSGLCARIYSSLGELYLKVGEYQYAQRYFTSVLAYWEGTEGGGGGATGSSPAMLNAAQAMNNLADSYRLQGRFYDAEPIYRRALLLQESAYGDNSPLLIPAVKRLAKIYRKEGRPAAASDLETRIQNMDSK